MPINVLIAEDHPIYLDGLSSAIARRPGISIIGTPTTGDEAISEARRQRPDVLVLDVALTGLDGLAVIKTVTGDSPPIRVLVVSDDTDRATIYDAVSAGASGYVVRRASGDEICDAIVQIAAGRTVWHEEVQAALASDIRERADVDPILSPRELEIIKLVADGRSTAEVAGELYLSVATVKTHLHRAFTKLGVKDRAAAVAECLRRGLFD
jgi:two-component system nitrate/nitrite response regulator NarL